MGGRSCFIPSGAFGDTLLQGDPKIHHIGVLLFTANGSKARYFYIIYEFVLYLN